MGSRDRNIETFLRVLIIIIGIALLGLTVPYWIYLKQSVDNEAWVALGIYIASALILIILAVLAFIGAIKKNRGILLYFAVVMIVMLVFGIAQIIVTNLDITGCGGDANDNFSFLCSLSSVAYYLPMALLLFVNLLGAIVALVLRWRLNHDTSGKYYS
ncbi:hypothetical protein DLAC_10542 [Tieghemostelium lacteum]|uniref:Transmembrane protein n=1 Tax=Tieghemostelium lacteum TaxID=361077 RepID=A0A151Z4Q9_TIELA|nr:hypothetical protein DLAC_10542 [Tieghemostelium lacteum]|eukprot:KYQ88953.1 hypothetical protein DLAC_10542 [Tieghemostelium lacteum]